MEFNSLVYPAPDSKGNLNEFTRDPNMSRLIYLVDYKNKKG